MGEKEKAYFQSVTTTSNAYETAFGFTQEEVFAALRKETFKALIQTGKRLQKRMHRMKMAVIRQGTKP